MFGGTDTMEVSAAILGKAFERAGDQIDEHQGMQFFTTGLSIPDRQLIGRVVADQKNWEKVRRAIMNAVRRFDKPVQAAPRKRKSMVTKSCRKERHPDPCDNARI